MSLYLHASDVATHTVTRNALNATSIALRDELVELLTRYLGAKIRKVRGCGGWIAKLNRQIDALRDRYESADSRFSFHIEFSDCRFWLETKTYYFLTYGGGRVNFVGQTLSLGEWNQQTGQLVSLVSSDERSASNPKTDWQAADIVMLQACIASLKAELSDAESCLSQFVCPPPLFPVTPTPCLP